MLHKTNTNDAWLQMLCLNLQKKGFQEWKPIIFEFPATSLCLFITESVSRQVTQNSAFLKQIYILFTYR